MSSAYFRRNFLSFFGFKACGILGPQPGISSAPLAWKPKDLTTGPPEKSQKELSDTWGGHLESKREPERLGDFSSLSLHRHRRPPQGCGEWEPQCLSGGGDSAVPWPWTCSQPATGPYPGGKRPDPQMGSPVGQALGARSLLGMAGWLDRLHLFSREQCLQASQEASGRFLEPTVVSTRAVWTVSLPGTLTVPGTLSLKPAASCLPLSCECRFPSVCFWSLSFQVLWGWCKSNCGLGLWILYHFN